MKDNITYEDSLAFCLKISQPKWIEKLIEGSAWFGQINNYIEEAERTGNNDQGDKFEGVFARCKKDAPLVSYYTRLCGDDLEIIEDGEFCFLRRKSCRWLKAFCSYGIRNSDFQIVDTFYDSYDNLMGHIHYDINERMYNGFLQAGCKPSDVAGYYCSAGHLNGALEKALNKKGYKWRRAMVDYDVDLSSEFHFPITNAYNELWHKRMDLAYQQESRIIIYDFDSASKGLSIPFEVPSTHSGNSAPGQLYFEGTAYLQKIPD